MIIRIIMVVYSSMFYCVLMWYRNALLLHNGWGIYLFMSQGLEDIRIQYNMIEESMHSI